VAEGVQAERAGLDAVVAQGYEAGGHRGVFEPGAPDGQLGTHVLTRLLVQRLHVPVIAAGGIMDGAGIVAVLRLGAVAAQLGTAFVACPESSASAAHRAALLSGDAALTVMTTSISGRPARTLVNRFTALDATLSSLTPPDYPIAYDAGKALHAAAVQHGEHGYGAHWAGQGAPLARALPARELISEMLQWFVDDVVDELGSRREVEYAFEILKNGTSADRQLAVFDSTNDLKRVVDRVIAETAEGVRPEITKRFMERT